MVLNKGEVAQTDAPIELYRRPEQRVRRDLHRLAANELVLPGALLDGMRFASVSGWSVVIQGQSVSAKTGDSVSLGVRPEDIQADGPRSRGPTFTANVMLVERLGAETYLNVRSGDDALLVRVQGDMPIKIGEAVGLTLDPRALHLFDREGRSAAQ